MLCIEIAKLPLLWRRLKLTSEPENGLPWPKAPHGTNGVSLVSRPMVLKFSHASESPGGLVKSTDCWVPPPEIMSQ